MLMTVAIGSTLCTGRLEVKISNMFWLILVLAFSHTGVSQATLMYYWDSDNDAIKQLDLVDGQTDIVDSNIPSGQSVYEMAVDPTAGVLYQARGRGIAKLDLDIGSSEVIVPWSASDTAVDPLHGHLYWTYSLQLGNGIARANLDGSSIETVIDSTVTGSGFSRLSLDLLHGHIYWSSGSSIGRVNLDGSDHEVLVTNIVTSDYGGLAVDPVGGKVYWTRNNFPDAGGDVWRANLDGSDPERLLSDLLFDDYPQQIELDFFTGKMYIDSRGGFWVQRANFDGTELETVEWLDHDWVGPIALDSIVIPEPASACSLLVGLALLLTTLTRRRSR